jgi:hypothetical protein
MNIGGATVILHKKSIASAELDSKVDHRHPSCNEIMSGVSETDSILGHVLSGQNDNETTSGNVAGSSESPKSTFGLEDKGPETRKHNTRGRNGIKKQRIEVRPLVDQGIVVGTTSRWTLK